MKNFIQSLLTGVLTVVAAISAILAMFLGAGLISGKEEVLVPFVVSVAVGGVSLFWAVRRKGGWTDFVSNLLPWP